MKEGRKKEENKMVKKKREEEKKMTVSRLMKKKWVNENKMVKNKREKEKKTMASHSMKKKWMMEILYHVKVKKEMTNDLKKRMMIETYKTIEEKNSGTKYSGSSHNQNTRV